MISILIFLFGLSIGSFLNVVIWRLHKQRSFFKGHSICPKCQHKLSARDLVPWLSFLVQKGRCRYCAKKISWQYPLVELATAVLFVLVYIKSAPDYAQVVLDWYFVAILIVIFVYDLRYYLILDKVTVPAMVIAFIFNWAWNFGFTNLLLAGIIGVGFFSLQFWFSNGRWIGGGDLRLGFLMGLMLGWPQVLVALFLAYLIGALCAIPLLATGQKKWGSEIPFGTFLTLATVISLLWGPVILGWYLKLF